MGHSILDDDGTINSISASEPITSTTAHTYALVNQSSAAMFVKINSDTDTTFNPDYSVGTNPVAIGDSYVVEHDTTSLSYKIPAYGVAVFTAQATDDGASGNLTFDTTVTRSSHGSGVQDHQRIWLGQL